MTKSLISLNNPKAPASEAYRMIRTNLQYTNIDNQNKVIAFTSPKMKDGKTTTVCNIAITKAQAGERVLIIDCDLRKPRVHKLFSLPNSFGITDVIVKNKELHEVIRKSNSHENIDIITSGVIPPMPSELLSANSMKEIINRLREKYDVILIDTPPVLSVTDATIISLYVDGMILVVSLSKTTINEIKAAKRSLERVNSNILGTILTFAELSKKGYYYHYDYNYGEKQ